MGPYKKKKEPNLKCWHKINQNQVPKFAKQVEQIDLHVITQQQQNWKKSLNLELLGHQEKQRGPKKKLEIGRYDCIIVP